jgi:hypothetical protein
VLSALLPYFPRILMTTTVQGYEGTGRGFLLKFCATLPQWRAFTLDDPLRWVVLCSGYELGSQPGSWGPNVRTLLKPFELEELEQLLGGIHTALASVST